MELRGSRSAEEFWTGQSNHIVVEDAPLTYLNKRFSLVAVTEDSQFPSERGPTVYSIFESNDGHQQLSTSDHQPYIWYDAAHHEWKFALVGVKPSLYVQANRGMPLTKARWRVNRKGGWFSAESEAAHDDNVAKICVKVEAPEGEVPTLPQIDLPLDNLTAGFSWDQGNPEIYTFAVEDAAWPAFLKVHGFCVLRDVLPALDAERAENLFWTEIAHVVPGLERENPASWAFPKNATGIVRSFGLPQSDFAWAIRCHPQVHTVFAHIFNTDDLVVSTDSVKLVGCEIISPGERLKPWLHRDQLKDVDCYSIQGIYAFYEVGPHNSGTIVVPDSHVQFFDWDIVQDGSPRLRAGGRRRNSVRVPQCEQRHFMNQAIKPKVPGNGMILFNSRTIHASAPDSVIRWESEAQTGSTLPRPNRVAVSVAMCPGSTRSERTRARKILTYLDQGSTAHWPNDELDWPNEHDRFAKSGEVFDKWAHPKKEGCKFLPMPAFILERVNLL